jgi:ATP-dependent protease ClpP protease subunit
LIKSTKIASDYWMIAEEAKEYGMIDEVLKRSKKLDFRS